MKKYLARISLILFITTIVNARQEYFSRSFMFTRPAYYQLSTEQALWHTIIYEEQQKALFGGAFQLYPVYQHSINRPSVNRYFLIDGKNELLVAGDNVVALQQTRDVRAEWLGITNHNFSGVLTVAPEQRQAGFVFEYLQHLYHWLPFDFFENTFIDITIPLISVSNDLRLRQSNVQNPGTTFPRDIVEAFDQPAWQFSKVSPTKRTLTNVAEVELKFGSWYMDENFFQIAYYALTVIPVAKKQNAEFLFNPFVGNNQHICIGGAANFQILLNRDPSRYAWCFFAEIKSILRIKNKQFRTFDLVGKPWSRFMLYNTLGTGDGALETNVPGVNVLTRRISLRPYNAVDFSLGWRVRTGRLEAEWGYSVWGHMHEHIDQEIEEFPVPFGIAGRAPGTTASASTIAFQAPNDPVQEPFVPLNSRDLNHRSAEAASALNQKIHLSIGLIQGGALIGVGFFGDIPQKNSSLENWGIWIKLASTF